MPRPQNSARGFFAKQQIDAGSQSLTYNSTGVIFENAVFVSGQATGGKLSANSTAITTGGGLIASGTVVVSGQAVKGLLSANSTSLTLPGNWKMTGSHANAIFTANSTGIKIGTKYISTNSTGTTIA